MDSKLLAILRCPVTKQKLSLLEENEFKTLLQNIEREKVLYHDESVVKDKPSAALITENQNTLYLIVNGLPVMLEEKSIDYNVYVKSI